MKDINSVITKNGNTYLVSSYNIIGTRECRVEVYEPTKLGNHSHTTLTLELGQWWGSVASRTLPADVNAIPVGQARFEAIRVLRGQRVTELTEVAREAMSIPTDAICDGHRLCWLE